MKTKRSAPVQHSDQAYREVLLAKRAEALSGLGTKLDTLPQMGRLPPAERSRQLGNLNMYANLAPEKQAALTKQIQLFNHLPDDRIAVLRPELVRLHRMAESERSDRIASEEFKSKFTPAEQQMLAEISPYFPFSVR